MYKMPVFYKLLHIKKIKSSFSVELLLISLQQIKNLLIFFFVLDVLDLHCIKYIYITF